MHLFTGPHWSRLAPQHLLPSSAGLCLPQCTVDSWIVEPQSTAAQDRKQVIPYEEQSEAGIQVRPCRAAQSLRGNRPVTTVAEVQGATEGLGAKKGDYTSSHGNAFFVLLPRWKVLKEIISWSVFGLSSL